MKRTLLLASLLGPSGLLILFWLRPEMGIFWRAPLFHFYIVTFFTFTALVVASFTAIALGENAAPRHRLLAAAFTAMGIIFLVHGVTTPGAILFTFNPGIRWGAWLTLFVGGLVFATAAFDTPERPLSDKLIRRFSRSSIAFGLTFTFIVIFAPHWLDAIDSIAAPWHGQTVYGLTVVLWLWSAGRLTWLWRRTKRPIDGAMALIAAWLTIATISMHSYQLWYLSWWIYHAELLLGAITAVTLLILEYRQLRQFRLTYHYAAIGLIIAAALTLTASHFFSKSVEQQLVEEKSAQATRISQNLAFTFVCALPNNVTAESLPQVTAENNLFDPTIWQTSATNLDIDLIALLDTEQNFLFQSSNTTAVATEATLSADYTQEVIAGGAVTNLYTSDQPLFPTAEGGYYLQTFVPVQQDERLLAILTTVQDVPDLIPATIKARIRGLLIAGLSIGLLYLIMLMVIYRAEQLIITRNDELATAYTNLQAAENLRDDLTSMVIHDLRTPLTSISLSIGLLEHLLPANERAHALLTRTQSASQRMMTLINQMLDVTRLEAGQLNPSIKEEDMTQLLLEKIESFIPQAQADNKTITLDKAYRTICVQMDKNLISRVLDNLIGNALKYTEPNGRITLRAIPNGNTALIQVIDDGEGIPEDAAAQIFNKFYQIKDTTGQPLRRGTGLGLSFCKLVLEAHNGRIWVESTPGQGSTFSFTLPFVRTQPPTPSE